LTPDNSVVVLIPTHLPFQADSPDPIEEVLYLLGTPCEIPHKLSQSGEYSPPKRPTSLLMIVVRARGMRQGRSVFIKSTSTLNGKPQQLEALRPCTNGYLSSHFNQPSEPRDLACPLLR
jgi:hypothetical protein